MCVCVCVSSAMYDERTGRLVGIDFGHAFGSATLYLPGVLSLHDYVCGCARNLDRGGGL